MSEQFDVVSYHTVLSFLKTEFFLYADGWVERQTIDKMEKVMNKCTMIGLKLEDSIANVE